MKILQSRAIKCVHLPYWIWAYRVSSRAQSYVFQMVWRPNTGVLRQESQRTVWLWRSFCTKGIMPTINSASNSLISTPDQNLVNPWSPSQLTLNQQSFGNLPSVDQHSFFFRRIYFIRILRLKFVELIF